MASPLSECLSTETDVVDSLNQSVSELHSETETDEQSEATTDTAQRGERLISKKNTKSLVWKYFGFIPDEDGKPANSCNPKSNCVLTMFQQSLVIPVTF